MTTIAEGGTDPGVESGSTLRTVAPIVFECTADKIVASSPRARRRLRVAPHVAALLMSARAGLKDAPVDDPLVARLIAAGFLVPEDATDQIPEPWRVWGTTAWSFHTRIRDTDFVPGSQGGTPERTAAFNEHVTSRPMPETSRAETDDRILLLPRVRHPMTASYRDVLEGRRTHRDFEDRPVDLDRFADMLHYCFAPLRFVDAGPMGVMQLRAAASGGARHETTAFAVVWNVDGITPGLYHYDDIRHGLVPLAPSVSREELERITFRQGLFTTAAFGVLTVAVADRLSWKYQHPRAYKILLQDVGHVAQVFSMTAAALGLGAAVTGAFKDTETDDLLQLDRPCEFTTFALACGHPILRPDGLPLRIKPPETAQASRRARP